MRKRVMTVVGVFIGLVVAHFATTSNCSLEGTLVEHIPADAVDCSNGVLAEEANLDEVNGCIVRAVDEGRKFHLRFRPGGGSSAATVAFLELGNGPMRLRYEARLGLGQQAYEVVLWRPCEYDPRVRSQEGRESADLLIHCVNSEAMHPVVCSTGRGWLIFDYLRAKLPFLPSSEEAAATS